MMDTWRVAYPSPPDFNFDYARLLREARSIGVARNPSPGLSVAIVGAGVAGLAAAHELFRCGVTNIDLYEASERIGGRLRSQPVEGQSTVFELGAMRLPMFTQAEGPSAMFAQYADAFGLTSQPFPTASSHDVSFGVYSSRSSSFRLKARDGVLPDDPETAIVRRKWESFAIRVLTAIRTYFNTPEWPGFWHAFERHYWRHSVRTVLLAPVIDRPDDKADGNFGGAGMTERELGIMERSGIGEGSWASKLDLSAMLAFRLLLFGYFDDVHLIQGRFDERGDHAGGPHAGDGTLVDSLGQPLAAPRYLGVQSLAEALFYHPVQSAHVAPVSLYDALSDRRYGIRLYTRRPVQSITRMDHGVRVACATHEATYDAVLLTAPMSGNRCAIRMNDFDTSQLPVDVVAGDRMSHWLASSKVFVALKERYWETSAIPQLIATDNFLDASYGYAVQTARVSDPGVLLLSYTWEDLSNTLLGERDDDALVSHCISTLDRMLSDSGMGVRLSDYVDERQSAVIHWYRQPTIRGAGRLYRPGTAQPNHALLAYNQRHSARSGVYLAGEAYTTDGAFVESALRMAFDAVIHLLNNHGAVFSKGFDVARDYPRRSEPVFDDSTI